MPKRITSQTIKAMQPPASGNAIVWDTEEKGLGVRMTAAGAVSFVLRYVVDGRERRMTLGPYAENGGGLTVSAARSKAQEIKGAIVASRDKTERYDPLEKRREAR